MSDSATQFTALVLAGSRQSEAGSTLGGTSSKALLPVRGTPMISRVVTTLSAAAHVGRIVVSGPQELGPWAGVEIVPAAGSPSRSVSAFLETFQGPWRLLITTADHPLLTPEMVDYFCRATLSQREEVSIAMAEGKMISAAYPQTRRTFYQFRDGGWSGCNMFGIKTPKALDLVRHWRSFEDNRKSPLKVIGAFGIVNLLGVLLKRWSATEAISRAGARFGVSAAPIPMPWPEAAIDVDTLEDLALAEAILTQRERRTG